MKPFVVDPGLSLRGKILLPGDKSIAHRAVILSSLSSGKTKIENFPANSDCLATVQAFRRLGVKIKKIHQEKDSISVIIPGAGLRGLKKPNKPLFIAESGTTYRLLLGVLAGQDFETKLLAGKSLSRRPMARVTKPLRMMGVKINSRLLPAGRQGKTQDSKQEEYPPINIKGGNLKAITYKMPVASAQVKSAVLLAGLFAKGKTVVIEPVKTRDHTERLLKLFKAGLSIKRNKITIDGSKGMVSAKNIYVPGDISSASFFIVAGAIAPNSEILIKNVSLNPTRTGVISALKRMGANIKITKSLNRLITHSEPLGDLLVKTSSLKGTVVKKEEIPSLIDELPVLMVAASVAKGKSIFEGAGELRVKETDRIRSMTENLRKMGADIRIKRMHGENIVINGVKQLKGAMVKSFGDHRTAMSMVIAGLAACGKTRIDDISCASKSFPGFIRILKGLIK